MRIVFLVSSMHAGGAERVAATLANAWSARGESVVLVPTYTGKGSCFYPISPEVELLWLADRIGAAANPALAGLKKLRALRRLVREKKPDLIVSFLTNVNVMALLATRGLGVPVIVCERTNPAFSSNVGAVLRLLRKWTYPWASLVTVQAEASAEPFKHMVPGIRRLAVIPNPLPPELFDTRLAACVPDARGRYRLMAMGRLVPAKQFGALIQAFSTLAARHANWDLSIWGDGPLRGALTQQIEAAGMSSRIALPGRTETPWQELAQAHAFALTSRVEGFPNVLLEAMALGLPCLAVDCPSGPREMTRNGEDGMLVPLGDQAALTRGLDRLLGDSVLRRSLADRAAVSVRKRYSLSSVLMAWDDLMAQAETSHMKGNNA
ncbi:glycosyltransferase family 4 protein [Paralcaligenes sp. KSB-10]|uniref:glycosyltransferase family 4 protein n=1 Tax=Paralcaligenes sp. KSB-10 TaxID=2901142 RepID=UPI001E46606A|nr:glycosyltransferase family 4 protein [Paralcaligenes sp. KSB-10]UHL64135.1 glycosyltransferase family 4 protein [Paralcaligenes sp. KSB-10]